MTPKPLPFVIGKKKQKQPQWTGRSRMTLVSALSSSEGAVLFADTREVLAQYTKKKVDKLAVYDQAGHSFRFAVAGAADDATHLELLQNDMAACLLSIDSYDLGLIREELGKTLTRFYSQHIWPRAAEKPRIEYLMVIQPIPFGCPRIIHIAESAVIIVDASEHHKSIGIGSYLADFLFNLMLGNCAGYLEQLVCAAAHVAKEVEENITDIGAVDRIAVFDEHGNYDEVYDYTIDHIAQRRLRINDLVGRLFDVATRPIFGIPQDNVEHREESIVNMARATREEFADAWKEWKEEAKYRKNSLHLRTKRKMPDTGT